MPRRWFQLLGAALLMTAAACGSTSGEADDAPAGTAEETSTTTAAPESGEEPASLNSFFGFDPNDPDASREQFRRWERRQQELIAACMANQGFEYVPVVTTSSVTGFGLDEEQFAREQGFGISTRFDLLDENYPPQPPDPNDAITAAMSESESDAYYAALYGEETELEAGAEESAATFWGGGCQGEAAQEVFGQADAIFSELEPLLNDLQERVDADPRLAGADQGWTACMSDRGFQYEDADDVWNTALDDLQKRYEAIAGSSDPFAGWSDERIQEFLANSSPQELDDFYEQFDRQARQNVDEEALAALQQEEIALAVANYECGEERRQLVQEVQSEYEKEFIRQNQDALLRARDSLNVG